MALNRAGEERASPAGAVPVRTRGRSTPADAADPPDEPLARTPYRRFSRQPRRRRRRDPLPAHVRLRRLRALALAVRPLRGQLLRRVPAPDLAHPLGTDQFGRDLMTRVALGGRVSIGIGFVGTFVILGIGMLYGAISGFAGGKLDNGMMRFLDALYGLPYLPFAIITLQVFGVVNFWTMVVGLTIVSWLTAARVVRGQVITLKENDYVRAARAVGARWYRILGRHVLPNTLGVLIVFVFLELPGVILGEAFLSFIGLGINPPKASWGSLAEEGREVFLATRGSS